MITTNQTVQAGNPCTAALRCRHLVGAATLGTCAFRRSLARMRAEIERLDQAAARGDTTAQQITALWLLTAEASTSFDHCPDNPARRQPS